MFIGREKELESLKKGLLGNKKTTLIYGKRKIGKTTLILEANNYFDGASVYYECLKSSLNDNVDSFSYSLFATGILPTRMNFPSFSEIFEYLSALGKKIHIIIDEYPYLKAFEKPETVDSLFQSIIDKKYENIHLTILGSHIGMMKDLLKESNALYGRFDTVINLQELNYLEASFFYKDKSAYEKVAYYALFGGSPFILNQLDSSLSLRENVERVILNTDSVAYLYASNLLLSDLSNTVQASRILSALGNGKKKYGEIEAILHMNNNGLLSKHLTSLMEMGLVKKTYPINRKDDNKKTYYECSDNLLRFYYAYIHKNKSALEMLGEKAFYSSYIEKTLHHFVSYRFEEIVRNYFSMKVKKGLLKEVYDIGSYFYDDPVNKTNGEFDVAIDRGNSYDVYEVKYLSSPLTKEAMHKEISEIRNIKGLKLNEIGFASVNGFEEKITGISYIDGNDIYNP